MKWFLSLSTRLKLLTGFGLMIVCIVATCFTAYAGMRTIQDAQRSLFERDFNDAVDMKDVRSNQNANRANELAMILIRDATQLDALQKDITARTNENTINLQRISDRNRDDSKIIGRIGEFQAIRLSFTDTRDHQVIPLIRQGRLDEATALATGLQNDQNQQMRSIVDELVDYVEQKARSAVSQSEQRANDTVRFFAIIGIIAVLSGAAMVVLLTQIIATPLREMSGVAQRVAAGDLSVEVAAVTRTDEVGALTNSFRSMIAGLRTLHGEIRDGVNLLGSSASEIVSTATQVASGAAETASAVGETTTTVEEVKQTAQLVSEKARDLSDSAQRAAHVSQDGRRAADAAAEGMQNIHRQMESLGQNMMRLSEQNQSIAEIISTVNGLAEQSNLLAVNASIEAAKAGDAGRGFAVVAGEVKALAEQSKQATAQVRGILGEIQKATSSAVLATEQGSRAVEAGLKQATESGEAIRLLAESIAEATQAALQIAASSNQQLIGMDQVAIAMENINQASSQNAASTRQTELAAQNLHELGQRLANLVEQYRV